MKRLRRKMTGLIAATLVILFVLLSVGYCTLTSPISQSGSSHIESKHLDNNSEMVVGVPVELLRKKLAIPTRIKCVSATTKYAIESYTIQWGGSALQSSRVEGGETIVQIHDGTLISAAVAAGGYISQKIDLSPGVDVEVRMVPIGSLELSITGGSSNQIYGITLLPPLQDAIPDIVSRLIPSTNDANDFRPNYDINDHAWDRKILGPGKLTWESLPALRGYRYFITRGLANLKPAPEHFDNYKKVGNELRKQLTMPKNLSGPFEIMRGEATRMTISAVSLASIRGRIALVSTEPATLPHVVIKSWEDNRFKGGLRINGWNSEAEVSAESSGVFSITEVLPGKKLLRAFWEGTGKNYYFLTRRMELQEGEHLDLGLVEPRGGSSVVCRVEYQMSDSLLATDAALRGRSSARAMILVTSRGNADEDSTWQMITVPVNQEFTVNNLVGKEVSFTIHHAELPKGELYENYTVIGGLRPMGVQLPLDEGLGSIVVPIRISATAKVRISFHYPSDNSEPLQFTLRNTSTGALVQGGAIPVGGVASVIKRVPYGNYQIFTSCQESGNYGGEDYLECHEPDIDMHVQLNPGVEYHGKFFDEAGMPKENQEIVFAYANLPRVPIFFTRTDNEGVFLFGGSVAGRELVVFHPSGARIESKTSIRDGFRIRVVSGQ